MPTRKVTRTNNRTVNTWATTDTQLIIVVVLLVLAYPFGVIFMWFWMREWPVWVKILLSIPLVFLILAFFAFIAFIALAIHRGNSDQIYRHRQYMQQYYNQQQIPPMMQRQLPPPPPPTYQIPSTSPTTTY